MQKTRILLVEDEAIIAEEVRDRLERLGHIVVDVVDTADLALAAARRDAPGLILMDIRLRGEDDGIDAATLITEWVDVPIIFMTAHSDAETIARAMLCHPYGYVVKPVRDSDLVTAIHAGLLRHTAETRLRACELQARAIVENSMDLIMQILPDGRMLSGNPAARKALGYSSMQLCRLSISDLVAERDQERLQSLLVLAAERPDDVELQLVLAAKDGSRIAVEGVVGRRKVGVNLDRLWLVLHPAGVATPAPEWAECPPKAPSESNRELVGSGT